MLSKRQMVFHHKCNPIFLTCFFEGLDLMDVTKLSISHCAYPINLWTDRRHSFLDCIDFMGKQVGCPRHVETSSGSIAIDAGVDAFESGNRKNGIREYLKSDCIFSF